MDPTPPTIALLLAPFRGPHGGVPPFDQVDPARLVPALQHAMELARQQIAAIASATELPTFANTIAAFESAGREYGRARTLLETYTATMSDKAMQAIEEEMAPVMAAFADEVTQNAALFDRIRAVHAQRHTAGLTPEQIRLVEVHYRSFARKGAALDAEAKARLAQLNQRLAELFTTFGQRLLADEEQDALLLDDPAELAGLPDSLRDSLAAAAEAKGKRGAWLVANTRSSVEPFLMYAVRRDVRERAWRMWMTRGEHEGPTDNRPIIREILALRAERAKLLGFPTHAHWILDDTMAKTPDAAMALMKKVWTAAVARVREEVADMQAIADAEGAGHAIAAWDYRYYAEQVRRAKYDLDANEVKAYLQLDHMRDALFWSAKQLFDLDFTRVDDVPVYHPDVTAYSVTRGSGGERVGMWYFDPYARDGKHSGAWMSEYRTQEQLEPATPIVSNNSNFVKGRPGEPILISWDDAVTLFHEFGHALHGLLSRVTYPRLAGTNTLTDFVEFPSQLNEHWLATPELLDRFALHHETNQPMPRALVDKIVKAKHHGSGFSTVEYLMSALYDLEIHQAPGEVDPLAFERELFEQLGAPPEIVMRHRPTQFAHIFAGDGYSAGYYSYLWADTLTADAGEAFQEAGGYYDRATARRYHDEVMCVGNSVAPEIAFRAFRGRDVDTNALMRDRGFPVA